MTLSFGYKRGVPVSPLCAMWRSSKSAQTKKSVHPDLGICLLVCFLLVGFFI